MTIISERSTSINFSTVSHWSVACSVTWSSWFVPVDSCSEQKIPMWIDWIAILFRLVESVVDLWPFFLWFLFFFDDRISLRSPIDCCVSCWKMYWVLLGFTVFFWVKLGFYWVLLGLNILCWVFTGFSGFGVEFDRIRPMKLVVFFIYFFAGFFSPRICHFIGHARPAAASHLVFQGLVCVVQSAFFFCFFLFVFYFLVWRAPILPTRLDAIRRVGETLFTDEFFCFKISNSIWWSSRFSFYVASVLSIFPPNTDAKQWKRQQTKHQKTHRAEPRDPRTGRKKPDAKKKIRRRRRRRRTQFENAVQCGEIP